MKTLSYQTLKEIGYRGYLLEQAPERILQFGEGNFLRAFADYFVDVMNEKTDFHSKAVVIQPIAGGDQIRDFINEQDGLYTLILRGNEGGKKVSETRIISCVHRCLNPYSNYNEYIACAENPDLRFIICNTTEAGIRYDPSCRQEDQPPSSYPAKLTQFLFARFQKYGNEKGKVKKSFY